MKKTIKESYEALKGVAPIGSATQCYLFLDISGCFYLRLNYRDGHGDNYKYICTVEEFNNYKSESMKTVIDAVNAFHGYINDSIEYIYDDDYPMSMVAGFFTSGVEINTRDLLCTREEFNKCVDEMTTNYGTSETYADYKAIYEMINDDMKPALVDDDSRQAKLSNIGNILHNLSCSMDDDEQDQFGEYASYLWDLSAYFGESAVGVDKTNSVATIYTQEMHEAGTSPSVGMMCLYKERGGVNWCKCKIIAIHDKKVWLANIDSGSCPLNNITTLEFKPLTPPIVLKDGEAYQFDLNGITRKGVYCKLDGRLIWSRGDVAICDCKSIQLLGVKS